MFSTDNARIIILEGFVYLIWLFIPDYNYHDGTPAVGSESDSRRKLVIILVRSFINFIYHADRYGIAGSKILKLKK